MEDFVYWRHPTLPGIKVEEVTEGVEYNGAAWLDMARQIYCENGKDEYREIGHFQNGAPFLFGSTARISMTHCRGMLAVATLPDTPDVTLGEYSDKACLGIDAERADRSQVLALRERFLSADELAMIPADDVEANILAWTIKEAAYKAAFIPGLDFRSAIRIDRMPHYGPAVPVYDKKEFSYDGRTDGFDAADYGKVSLSRNDGSTLLLDIYSYRSDDFVVTLAFCAATARFHKRQD